MITLHFELPAAEPLQLLATESQLGRLGYLVLTGSIQRETPDEDEPIETRYSFAVEAQRLAREASGAPSMNLRAYSNNLKTLAGIAQGHAIPMVFITQQTTWNSAVDPKAKDWHWMLRVGDVRYSEESMDAAVELMNDEMRQVADSNGLALYDLARTIPKSSEYFYDDVHFNTRGAALAGEGLAAGDRNANQLCAIGKPARTF